MPLGNDKMAVVALLPSPSVLVVEDPRDPATTEMMLVVTFHIRTRSFASVSVMKTFPDVSTAIEKGMMEVFSESRLSS